MKNEEQVENYKKNDKIEKLKNNNKGDNEKYKNGKMIKIIKMEKQKIVKKETVDKLQKQIEKL